MSFASWYENLKKNSVTWRAKNLKPVLSFLAKLKITPNKITFFRLLFVFPIAYYYYAENLWGVLVFYLLFWFLDLLDGALARYLNISSDKGRFFDSMVDNFMYGILILGFVYLDVAWPWIFAYNILIEFIVQLLATVKKCKNKPTDWIISVTPNIPYFKTLAHLILIFYLFKINILLPGFIVLNIWLSLTAVYYLLTIRKK